MSAKCPLGKSPQDILASFPGSLLKKKGGESLHGTVRDLKLGQGILTSLRLEIVHHQNVHAHNNCNE